MEGPHFPIIACSFVAFHSGTGVVVIAIVVINTINAAAAAAAALVTVGAAHCHSSSLVPRRDTTDVELAPHGSSL